MPHCSYLILKVEQMAPRKTPKLKAVDFLIQNAFLSILYFPRISKELEQTCIELLGSDTFNTCNLASE